MDALIGLPKNFLVSRLAVAQRTHLNPDNAVKITLNHQSEPNHSHYETKSAQE